jgi:hypothetical protein
MGYPSPLDDPNFQLLLSDTMDWASNSVPIPGSSWAWGPWAGGGSDHNLTSW